MEQQIKDLILEIGRLKVDMAVIKERTEILHKLNETLDSLNDRQIKSAIKLEGFKNWVNIRVISLVTFINGLFWTAFLLYVKLGDK